MDKRLIGGLCIYVPRGYGTSDGPEPTGRCYVCDTPLYGEPAANARHLRRCAMERLPELQAREAIQKRRMAIFDEENWSPEAAAHVRRVGDRMREQGRLVMRKNERVFNE